MLRRLGHVIVRRRRWVLVATFAFVLLAGALGGNVASMLSSGGFDDPDAEATAADEALDDVFGSGTPNLVLLVTAKSGDVDDREATAFGAKLTEQLANEEGVEQAVSYWSLGSPPPLKSNEGAQALVLARVSGTQDEILETTERLAPDYRISNDVATVDVGGQSADSWRSARRSKVTWRGPRPSRSPSR
jgi:RND superfamily putative drug exporter